MAQGLIHKNKSIINMYKWQVSGWINHSNKVEYLKSYITVNSIYDPESDIDNYWLIIFNNDFIFDYEEFDFRL